MNETKRKKKSFLDFVLYIIQTNTLTHKCSIKFTQDCSRPKTILPEPTLTAFATLLRARKHPEICQTAFDTCVAGTLVSILNLHSSLFDSQIFDFELLCSSGISKNNQFA